ncbi:MAG: phosphotransferase [Gammaproteobacteria bacterium]|nr:phosphotransferase [Gammaproteobacteria bacterium]
MELQQSIRHNLEFLQTEVIARLDGIKTYLDDTTPEAAETIFNRNGYITRLKQRIHDACYRYIVEMDNQDTPELSQLRAIDIIATELERIADLGEDFVTQSLYLEDPRNANFPKLLSQLDIVIEALTMVPTALFENDTQLAIKIGRTHDRLDRKFRKLLKKNAASLRDTSDAENLLSISFSAYAIERMGDSLLNISEAIISTNLGMVMDTTRFQAMQASISKITENAEPEALQIENVAETRSGAAISSIQLPDGDSGTYTAIFKQGQTEKLMRERKGVESWHDVFPGLAPQILSWRKKGKSASLLIEHLSGLTFERIVLNESAELLDEALQELGTTLHSVWTETLAEKPVSAEFMQQLDKRMADVYAVHPEFQDDTQSLCGYKVPSFDFLAKRAAEMEADLAAPFSVYIHGDFNIDNILYDSENRQLRYVDLHRSRYMDYVQDVSVFMVSNYRLQVLDPIIRRRIAAVICSFYRTAAEFADRNSDNSFELRLALGLVRSLATSTRFILDRNLARGMFLRARYLLEQLVNLESNSYNTYRVPIEEVFCG